MTDLPYSDNVKAALESLNTSVQLTALDYKLGLENNEVFHYLGAHVGGTLIAGMVQALKHEKPTEFLSAMLHSVAHVMEDLEEELTPELKEEMRNMVLQVSTFLED